MSALTQLARDVQRHYGIVCPCCGIAMRPKSVLPNRDILKMPTRAHLHARGHPERRGHDWFRACGRCNFDQGALSIDEWFLILAYRDDPRADNVLALLQFLGRVNSISAKRVQVFMKAVERAAQSALKAHEKAAYP